MKTKPSYLDRVVANLQHKYGKEELIAHLNKELRDARVRNGHLLSEIDQLKDDLEKRRIEVDRVNGGIYKEARKQAVEQGAKEDAWQGMRLKVKKAEKMVITMKKSYTELMMKYLEVTRK